MKLFKSLIIFCIFLFAININAQDYLSKAKTLDGTSIGIGIGQDFGGIGLGILHYGNNKNMGIFGGVGYTPAGVGINGGLKLRLVSPKNFVKFNPFILGMYGYTSAIYVSNDTQYNKMFYGATVGGGLDFKVRKTSRGFWTFAILLPINKSKANNYIQDLTYYRQIKFSTEQSSLTYSIGYRYLLN